jgi:hypothetical protein
MGDRNLFQILGEIRGVKGPLHKEEDDDKDKRSFLFRKVCYTTSKSPIHIGNV